MVCMHLDVKSIATFVETCSDIYYTVNSSATLWSHLAEQQDPLGYQVLCKDAMVDAAEDELVSRPDGGKEMDASAGVSCVWRDRYKRLCFSRDYLMEEARNCVPSERHSSRAGSSLSGNLSFSPSELFAQAIDRFLDGSLVFAIGSVTASGGLCKLRTAAAVGSWDTFLHTMTHKYFDVPVLCLYRHKDNYSQKMHILTILWNPDYARSIKMRMIHASSFGHFFNAINDLRYKSKFSRSPRVVQVQACDMDELQKAAMEEKVWNSSFVS